MYIVIPIDKDSKYTAPARLMPVAQYDKLCEIMRGHKPELHIVDISQIDNYPPDVLSEEVMRYVNSL